MTFVPHADASDEEKDLIFEGAQLAQRVRQFLGLRGVLEDAGSAVVGATAARISLSMGSTNRSRRSEGIYAFLTMYARSSGVLGLKMCP